jgi:hypothetical protein
MRWGGASRERGAVAAYRNEYSDRAGDGGSWPAGRNSDERTTIDGNYSIPGSTHL